MERIVIPTPADSGAVRGFIGALRRRYRFLESFPIGACVCGRELFCLRLGQGDERVLFAAAFHAQEWLTSLLLLRFCEDMCAALAGDGMLADIPFARGLCGRSIYMIPQMNPDGVDIAIHGAQTAGIYAATVRALGGDSYGVWSANARGVDLNHNYDAGWDEMAAAETAAGITGPAPRQWRGPYPASEPETKALITLCARVRFRHVIALHSQGEEIYWQYGDNTPDQSHLMAKIMGACSGYTVAQPTGLASHGGFKDWFIQTTGRAGFTWECGKAENPLPQEEFEPIYARIQEMMALSALM